MIEWKDIVSDALRLPRLRDNFAETMHYYHPPLDDTVRDIMREGRGEEFKEGTMVGAASPARPSSVAPSLAVIRALKFQRTVWQVNSEIAALRAARLGLAQKMRYLVLDKDQEGIIKEWKPDA